MAVTKTKTASADAQVNKAKKQLETALARQYEASNAIRKEGTELILPEYMDVPDAIKMLTNHQEQMESFTERTVRIECHPNDGLVAFYMALKSQFGNVLGESIIGFFTHIPGNLTVPISYNQTISVPSAEVVIPGLEDDLKIFIQYQHNPNPIRGLVTVLFKYRRKYTPLIDGIEKAWKDELIGKSIFKGQAINSAFEYIDLQGSDTSKIVYSDRTEKALNANIFTPLIHRDSVRKAGVPIKRTILLVGPFGTGKSLTALKAAQVAVANGWTFIQVRPEDSFENALSFASKKQFQPCLVFFEDVDTQTSGDRSEQLNKVLNTIDGILAKKSEVLTILTTNRAEFIHPGMLRPGRIDAVVDLGTLDKDAVTRLVKVYGGDKITGALDSDRLYVAAKGYVPAFVADAVSRAKLYAITRDPANGALITSEDVEAALEELRPQFDMMMGTQKIAPPTFDTALRSLVGETIQQSVLGKLKPCAIDDDND